MIVLLENNIRIGKSSVMGDGYAVSDENKNILCFDANNLYGWAISEHLPYDENNFDKNVKLEDDLNTLEHSDIDYFVEVDLSYLHIIREKTKNFPFAPENEENITDDFIFYMKKIKPKNYTKT